MVLDKPVVVTMPTSVRFGDMVEPLHGGDVDLYVKIRTALNEEGVALALKSYYKSWKLPDNIFVLAGSTTYADSLLGFIKAQSFKSGGRISYLTYALYKINPSLHLQLAEQIATAINWDFKSLVAYWDNELKK